MVVGGGVKGQGTHLLGLGLGLGLDGVVWASTFYNTHRETLLVCVFGGTRLASPRRSIHPIANPPHHPPGSLAVIVLGAPHVVLETGRRTLVTTPLPVAPAPR
jgi:hypothetical protein